MGGRMLPARRRLMHLAIEMAAQGITLRKIVKKIGVPLGTVQRWCDGIERPNHGIRLTSPENRRMNSMLWRKDVSKADRYAYFKEKAGGRNGRVKRGAAAGDPAVVHDELRSGAERTETGL